MFKLGMFLIAVSVLVGAVFFFVQTQNPVMTTKGLVLNKNSSDLGTVVRALVDVKEGVVVRDNMVKEEPTPKAQIRDMDIKRARFAVGKRAERDIFAGQIITSQVLPDAGDRVPSILTSRAIAAGALIQKSDLWPPDKTPVELIINDDVERGPTDPSVVIGRRARILLPEDHRIVDSDLSSEWVTNKDLRKLN